MFRFTIRDVLWLMVVVALAVGWWLDDRAWNNYHEETMALAAKDAFASYNRIIELQNQLTGKQGVPNEPETK